MTVINILYVPPNVNHGKHGKSNVFECGLAGTFLEKFMPT